MNAEEPHDPLTIQRPCRRYGMDEAIHPVQIAAYRRMTAGQKLDAMSSMYKMARRMLANRVLQQHSDWDSTMVEREVSLLFANATS